MLGAQINNSSNYPSVLPRVWPVMTKLSVNTVEAPVAWEQLEPIEGPYDFSYVDALLKQAREHDVRVVLLWFGTWKNTAATYVPEWVKADGRRFPRNVSADGRQTAGLSPHGAATLDADRRAFVRLMEHVRQVDPQHTIIMVQPQNEVGVLGTARDFSPTAQRLFAGAVPQELTAALGKPAGTWSQVFGPRAEQSFNAWYIARYVDAIAKAGKAVLPLPLSVNAALTNPFKEDEADRTASGGPNWNVIPIWKAAASNIDLLAPDIYSRDHDIYVAQLTHYSRPDNALMIPETGNAADFARFIWPALGLGAIGFAPFGMDGTGYSNFPLGAQKLDDETIEAFAAPFRLLAPIARDWARIAFAKPTWGVAKNDSGDQSTDMGRWRLTAQFGLWQMKERDDPRNMPNPTASKPIGGAVVAQLGPDEFLVAGTTVRVRFAEKSRKAAEFLSVEEGTFQDGRWVMTRRWNGDQTDFGLNLTDPTLLKVRLRTID